MTLKVATNKRCTFCRLCYRRIPARANLPGLNEVFARLESPSIIGGNTARANAGRFSYWAAQPAEILVNAHKGVRPRAGGRESRHPRKRLPHRVGHSPLNIAVRGLCRRTARKHNQQSASERCCKRVSHDALLPVHPSRAPVFGHPSPRKKAAVSSTANRMRRACPSFSLNMRLDSQFDNRK